MNFARITAATSVFLIASFAARAGEIVIAETNRCDYQVVVPDGMPHPALQQTLASAAAVMQEMFKANGWTNVPVVKESQSLKEKPGIYLGDTAAARAAGIYAAKLPVWTYTWKSDGKNVVIAGRDWAASKIKDTDYTPCSHGTVKGLTDFMREFCGARFLSPGGMPGIEFLPAEKIAVPDNLNLRKEPMVSYNYGGRPVTDIALISLNFFDNVNTEFFGHTHELAVPAGKYAETHPEYFALVGGKRIREYKHGWLGMVKEPHLCYSNKEVQELIYRDMLRSFDAGYLDYVSLQADGFQPCQCDECKKMFDTDDWGEKFWLLNKKWAERLLKDRPGKTLTVIAYGPTGKPPASFKEFPKNMRVSTSSTTEAAFRQWEGYTIPCGFVGGLHGWGNYHLCGYLPVRTPLFSEKTVKMHDVYNVKGIGQDSAPAVMWALEGPTVYVYGRMYDDVKTNSALKLVDEYIRAAYGKAASPMGRFFDELHHTLEIYADVFGVDNGTFQTYKRADGRSVRYLTSDTKLRLIGFLYPPETLDLLESHLAQAEKTSGLSDKHRLRLALARREFDYLKSTARVVHLYNAYLARKDKPAFDQLLSEMEKREKTIWQWYNTNNPPYKPGIYFQEPIATNWPMYIGGRGYYNDHLLRNGGSYLSTPVQPFTWNISEMRRAPMFEPKKLAVKKTGKPMGIEPASWNDIPSWKLGPLSLGAAAPKYETAFKIACDASALYIRFEGNLPDGWIKPEEAKRDDGQIVNRESFSAVFAPDNNPARYYRFAGGPAGTARYEGRHGFIEDSIDPRFDLDDLSWNPEWKYECAVTADHMSWSAVMVIPFQSLGVAAPAAGMEWKANFGRLQQPRPGWPREESLWSSNPGTKSINDRNVFGTLIFE